MNPNFNRTTPTPGELLARADSLRSTGHFNEALAFLDAALALAPREAVIHCKRGLVLKDLRRWNDALASLDQGIELAPTLAPAHMDRGNVLQELGRLDEALRAYDRALDLQPRYLEAQCNRGTVLHRLARLDEAIASYEAALTLEPRLDAARFNRATALSDLGRTREALEGFAQTQQRYPNLAVAHWNEALCRLRAGDFEHGLPKFEWRWRYPELGLRARSYAQPLWDGSSDLRGRRLLVHPEQGLGDMIQFCRYVPLLAARGIHVVLETPPPLVPLLETLDGSPEIAVEGHELPAFDAFLPVMSLPLVFGTRVESIPAQVPYLRADPERVRAWANRLRKRMPVRRPRVGVAWAGNAQQANDYQRSMSLRDLIPMFDCAVDWISLQRDLRPGDAELCHTMQIHDFHEELHDFAETAALASNLDLVISVCTSSAHLAGALGLPVWVLLCHAADWRWLANRSDSPWYPSARLFRQAIPRDWRGVAAGVRVSLRERFALQE